MSIKITHARIDENGNAHGGQAGDQNKKEICTTDFYIHSKGWVVLRPITTTLANKIADTALAIAANDNFGYDQDQRNTGIEKAKAVNYDVTKVNKPCELDCSSLVRLCCLAAGIPVADFYTAIEASALEGTGRFNKISFTSEADLRRGDVLVTKTKGHTVVVTSADHDPSYTGWQMENGKWYYYDNGEKLKRSWVLYKNHWYRMGVDGAMLIGWHYIVDDGKLRACYFDETEENLGMMWHEADDRRGFLEIWTIK